MANRWKTSGSRDTEGGEEMGGAYFSARNQKADPFLNLTECRKMTVLVLTKSVPMVSKDKLELSSLKLSSLHDSTVVANIP